MIHIALIGTNSICRLHAEGLLLFPGRCRITALVDIRPENAENFKKKYHLDCPVFSSHEELLSSGPAVDSVHICTPPFTHAPIAVDCMNAGKHVLVEKPMAASLSECDTMLEASRKNGVLLSVIAQNRFYSEINWVKSLIESGLLGKICCSHVRSYWWRGHEYYDTWWRGLWEKEGGGPTLNHAVHQIDLLNWIRGQMPSEVFSMLSNVLHDNSEVEDISLSLLKYRDKTLGDITGSVIHHGEGQALIFQCEYGKISFPWDIQANTAKPDGFPMENTILKQKINDRKRFIKPLIYEGHTGQIDNFLMAAERGTDPLITGIDGRNTLELITAIYKSGCLGQPVKLPIQPEDDFYTSHGMIQKMKAQTQNNF